MERNAAGDEEEGDEEHEEARAGGGVAEPPCSRGGGESSGRGGSSGHDERTAAAAASGSPSILSSAAAGAGAGAESRQGHGGRKRRRLFRPTVQVALGISPALIPMPVGPPKREGLLRVVRIRISTAEAMAKRPPLKGEVLPGPSLLPPPLTPSSRGTPTHDARSFAPSRATPRAGSSATTSVGRGGCASSSHFLWSTLAASAAPLLSVVVSR